MGHHRLQVVRRLAEGAVGDVVQPAEGQEARRALGRQHIGGAVAHLVLLVGRHLSQQPVQRAIGQLALAMPALVVLGDEAGAEHPFARRRRGSVVALGVGQGEAVPDRRLDRIQQVLVAFAPAFIAVRQLDLGEEIAAEGLAAQLADLALLAVELLLGLRRQRGPGAGRGDAVLAPHARAIGQAERTGAEQQQSQQHDQEDEQKRTGAGPVVVVTAAGPPLADGHQQPRLWRRRRRRWDRDHHQGRLAAIRVHADPPLTRR